MGRLCTICAHSEHGVIDEVLETDRPLRDIAAQFGVSKAALHRHRQHLLALGNPPVQTTVTAPRTESRLWTFAKWPWRQIWGRKGVLAMVAGAIGYMVRGFTCRR